MKQKKNKEENKGNKSSSQKSNTELPKEKFNTGSHTPSSLRNVGPGYDDTGLADYSKSREIDTEDESESKNKKEKRSGNS